MVRNLHLIIPPRKYRLWNQGNNLYGCHVRDRHREEAKRRQYAGAATSLVRHRGRFLFEHRFTPLERHVQPSPVAGEVVVVEQVVHHDVVVEEPVSAVPVDESLVVVQGPLDLAPCVRQVTEVRVGVMTDIHGQTDIAGLYAIGETAFTGLHGANRMASNSLLECLVFAQAASEHILKLQSQPSLPVPSMPDWDESRVTDSDEEIVVHHNWDELRHFMWDYVGIVRSNKRLQRSQRRVQMLQSEIDEYYGNFRVTNDLLELRNLVMVAELIIRSAIRRQESRGLHYNINYPYTDDSRSPQNTILVPDNYQPAQKAAS